MSADTDTLAPPGNSREFPFTDRDFNFIRRLVGEQTGIVLAEAKHDMVYGRLSRRLRELGCQSFADYCSRLQADPAAELGFLVNAITTNLTSFFRERHHFDYLGQQLVPGCLTRGERLRIWSAGCSTGAEPYSIAMTVREADPAGRVDFRLLATDIDTNVLQVAQAGVYGERDLTGIDESRRRRWFLRGRGSQQGKIRVKDELRESIHFRPLNLIAEWPMKGPFDAIFCRNVVIYFDKQTQQKLFDRMADLLVDGGHLFIGHSETLYKVCDRFKLLGQTIYRKVA